MMDPNESLGADKVAEIEKHKYFLSERAGHDVGWEFAARDWQENFGAGEGAVRLDSASQSRPSKGLASILRRFLSRTKAAV